MMLNIKQILERLNRVGISYLDEGKVRKLAQDGVFPNAIKNQQNQWEVPAEDVDRYIRSVIGSKRNRTARLTVGVSLLTIAGLIIWIATTTSGVEAFLNIWCIYLYECGTAAVPEATTTPYPTETISVSTPTSEFPQQPIFALKIEIPEFDGPHIHLVSGEDVAEFNVGNDLVVYIATGTGKNIPIALVRVIEKHSTTLSVQAIYVHPDEKYKIIASLPLDNQVERLRTSELIPVPFILTAGYVFSQVSNTDSLPLECC